MLVLVRQRSFTFVLLFMLATLWGGGIAVGQSEPGLAQEVTVPKVSSRVTDLTNTLSAAQISSLEADIARFEDSTSNQLIVVIVPTIGGESIEEFALRVAEANRVGQRETDNGVVLLVAKDDRKLRIEVGYGLEGVLPDGLAGTIIRREITPHFRNGDYYAGVKAGVEAIMLATHNEYKASKREAEEAPTAASLILFLVFAFIFFFLMSRMRRASRVIGAAGLPILFGGGKGSSGSRSGWGGGGGFGGFSGGGGSFGGGGASGSW